MTETLVPSNDAPAVGPDQPIRLTRRRLDVILTFFGALTTVVLAVAALVAGGGVLAYQQVREDPWQAYAPEGRGFVVELDPSWDAVELEPEQAAVAMTATSTTRGLVLLVAPAVASDAAAALERTAAAVGPGAEIMANDVIDEDRTRLGYRLDDDEVVSFFLTRRCGALNLTVRGPAPFDDDTMAHIEEIGRRLRPTDDLVVPDREATDLPPGFVRLERNGTSLALPADFITQESSSHCLFAIESGGAGGGGLAADVIFLAGATAGDQVTVYNEVWAAGGTEVVDDTPAADGTVRRHTRTGTGESEALYYFVQHEAGVYLVEVIELGGQPWRADAVAQADRIAASLEVTG